MAMNVSFFVQRGNNNYLFLGLFKWKQLWTHISR